MNKTELTNALIKKTGLTRSKAADVVNAIFAADPGEGIIATELDAGGKVVIPGFGTFGTRQRAARTGTNPATGAKIQIAAKHYAYFKPGKTLRERVEK